MSKTIAFNSKIFQPAPPVLLLKQSLATENGNVHTDVVINNRISLSTYYIASLIYNKLIAETVVYHLEIPSTTFLASP